MCLLHFNQNLCKQSLLKTSSKRSPIPTRWLYKVGARLIFLQSFLEPVGSVGPKFPTIENTKGFKGNSGGNLTLLCPAQAFPVPLYR